MSGSESVPFSDTVIESKGCSRWAQKVEAHMPWDDLVGETP